MKRKALSVSIVFFMGFGINIFFMSWGRIANAQNWAALPPYNTLWPLWSPVLSPVNAATGLATPLVTSLTPRTVLPVQPGLTWDTTLRYPWLLYNTPLGMAYYDPIGGINLWPPRILSNVITGSPITLTLPVNYSALLPTPAWWILSNVVAANWSYLVNYPSYLTALPTATASTIAQPTLTSLLTGASLL